MQTQAAINPWPILCKCEHCCWIDLCEQDDERILVKQDDPVRCATCSGPMNVIGINIIQWK